jgi:plastocyanin
MVEMASDGMVFIPSYMTFDSGIQVIYIYIYIYLTAIGLLPGGSVYKRTYIQQGNHTYISRHHTAQHK